MSAPYSSLVAALGPIGWWKLADPAGSTTAVDSSGYGLTAFVAGTVTLGQPALITEGGTCAGFTGGGIYAGGDVYTTTAYEIAGAFTVSGWYATVEATGGLLNLNGTEPAVSTTFSPALWLSSGCLTGYSYGGATTTITDPSTSNDGLSHHFCLTFDGTDTLTLYRDGARVAQTTSAGASPFAGYWHMGNNPSAAGGSLTGALAELAFFDYALGAQQVAALYRAGSTQGDADLVGLLGSVRVGVAFNNKAIDDASSFTWAAPGTTGVTDEFTDITEWVLGYNTSGRGKQHDLDEVEAGQLTLTVDNTDGRFSPWNTAGPYYGLLLPKRWVQVQVQVGGTWYNRFTGHVSAWAPQWPDPFTVEAQIQCYDPVRLWNATNLTSSAYASQVLTDGAKSLWRLGDQPGSNYALDSGPNAANGNLIGDVVFGGPQPLAVDATLSATFSASGPGFITVPSSSVPSNVETMSIEAWILIDANNLPSGVTSENQYMDIWHANDLFSNALYFEIYCPGWNASNPALSQWKLELVGNVGTWNVGFFSSDVTLSDGQWHHLVATISIPVATLFVDGVAVGTGAPLGTGTWTPPIGVISDATDSWYGSMANIAVYTSTLSAAQVLNHYQLGTGGMVQQSTGQRVSAALDVVNWPASMTLIDTGYTTVQANTQSLTQTSALAMCQQAEQTEGGKFWCDMSGNAVFFDRRHLWQEAPYNTVQATFGDDPSLGEFGYLGNPALSYDDVDLYTQAFVQPQGGQPYQYTAPSATVAKYGIIQWQPPSTTLYLTTDTEGPLARAQWVVNTHTTPMTRIDSITVDMLAVLALDGGAAGSNVETLLSLDICSRVQVNRHSLPGGSEFSQQAIIEQVSETVSLGGDGGQPGWQITFTLSATDAIIPWIAGSSTYGVAGVAIAGY